MLKNRISEFVVGLIFGLGLIVSGMTDPGRCWVSGPGWLCGTHRWRL